MCFQLPEVRCENVTFERICDVLVVSCVLLCIIIMNVVCSVQVMRLLMKHVTWSRGAGLHVISLSFMKVETLSINQYWRTDCSRREVLYTQRGQQSC